MPAVPRPLPDPARALRALAGVDEDLLRPVWHERSRHTALGGVVLGTATIAAFSMWIAISQSLGQTSVLNLIPALVWFVFVLNLDRLLVTSMAGGARRASTLVMRIGVAMMFGFIIAEPLVIRIFQTAIEQHIRDERTHQLDQLRTRLVDCNSEATVTEAATSIPASCQGYVLSFPSTPASIQRELDGVRTQERDLQQVVETETAELKRLRDNASKECGGGSGDGFTGQVGFGPQCEQRINDANEYARTHPIEQDTQKLAALRTRISELEQSLSGISATFVQTRDAKIEERVAESKRHQGDIGFLERLNALGDLANASFAVLVGSWAIRLFFVAIDCLPVLVKFFGGSSAYDELFKLRSAKERRVFAEQLKTDEQETVAGLEQRQLAADNRVRMHRSRIDLEFQEHKAQMKMRLGDAVSALAAELRHRPRPRTSPENGTNGVTVISSPAGPPR